MSAAERDCDVLIVGGGLVGAALAHALAQLPLRIVLVEARDPRALEQPSFDGRVTALANGSQRILSGLGSWQLLEADVEPIRFIHISEQGRFGAARISAAEEGVAALGYTVENRVLGRLLWDGLVGLRGFESLAPATVTAVAVNDDHVTAEVDCAAARATVRAKLLVAADGARSSIRRALDIAAQHHDYGQRAVVLNVVTEAAHEGRAFERFTSSGPLAFLPLRGGRLAVIWTQATERADEVLALSDDAFRNRLQAAFGYRLGRITRIGERSVHALSRVKSDVVRKHRVVLIGNAALSLHPVAGQGFNLALRDVATLAEVIRDRACTRDGGQAAGSPVDVGARAVLERYHVWRAADQRKVAGFTHGLVRLFGLAVPGLGTARGLGLMAFDVLPQAKAALARQTMGRAGRLPRLARGLDLTS
jgi:2-octaprenyl-6-methoxyphenol hydroxylase